MPVVVVAILIEGVMIARDLLQNLIIFFRYPTEAECTISV